MSSKKYNSPEAIRIALGLKPWEEFRNLMREKIVQSNLSISRKNELLVENINTGRTTEMLVEAVYESQSRKVTVRGYSDRYTEQLITECRAMCLRLGLDPKNVILLSAIGSGLDQPEQVFHDHYYPYKLSL